jgi:hypothetical protein
MDRLEYKYLVPTEELSRLRRALAPFVKTDSHIDPERGEYTVRSIYLDTCALDYYYQKLSGIQHRRKLRIRGYDQQLDDSQVFLEIKRKNDMAISKARALLPFRQAGRFLINGNIDHYFGKTRDRRDARSFLYHLHRYSLRPVVLVTYDREAFFRSYDDSVRITFDKNLRSCPFPNLEDLYSERGMLHSLSGKFVLEVKFSDGIPLWLKTIVRDFGLERRAVSKYAISLERHRIPQRSSSRATFAFSPSLRMGERRPVAMEETRYQLAAG